MDTTLIRQIVIAIILGVLIGSSFEYTQRIRRKLGIIPATDERHHLLGIRTFIFLFLVSTLAGYMYAFSPMTGSVFIVGVILLIISGHVLTFMKLSLYGITSELYMICVLAVGFLHGAGYISYHTTLALGIIISIFISIKEQLRSLHTIISADEFRSLLKYGLLGIIIRPLMPDIDITLASLDWIEPLLPYMSDQIANVVLLNPAKLRELIVIISLITLVGQIGVYLFNPRTSYSLHAMFSGFVSSTGLLVSHATELRNDTNQTSQEQSIRSGAAIVAKAASYSRLLLLLTAINAGFSLTLLGGFGVLMLVQLIIGSFFITHSGDMKNMATEGEIHFSIKPILFFVALYSLIGLIYQFMVALGLTDFLIIGSLLGGFVGTTSVLLNIGDILTTGSLALEGRTGAYMLVFVLIISNLVSNIFYAYTFGTKGFGSRILMGFGVSMICYSVAARGIFYFFVS